MRWRIKPKPKRTEWHLWFAWFPVPIDQQYVWLERVYRKAVPGLYGYDFEYRVRT